MADFIEVLSTYGVIIAIVVFIVAILYCSFLIYNALQSQGKISIEKNKNHIKEPESNAVETRMDKSVDLPSINTNLANQNFKNDVYFNLQKAYVRSAINLSKTEIELINKLFEYDELNKNIFYEMSEESRSTIAKFILKNTSSLKYESYNSKRSYAEFFNKYSAASINHLQLENRLDPLINEINEKKIISQDDANNTIKGPNSVLYDKESKKYRINNEHYLNDLN